MVSDIRRLRRGVLGLIVAVVLTAAAGLGVIGELVLAVHPRSSGQSRVSSIVLTAILAALLVGFVRIMVHSEHQIRHASGTPAGNALGPPPGVWRVGPYGRRHGPGSQAAAALVMLAGVVIAIVITIHAHDDAVVSQRTQSQGQTTSAVVDSITHVEHTSRHSTWYTALVIVSLPDGGSTVVHDPQDTNIAAGTTVQILVDPTNPDYAEFPGQPNGTTAGWVVGLVMALVFAAFDASAWFTLARMLRTRRDAMQPIASAT